MGKEHKHDKTLKKKRNETIEQRHTKERNGTQHLPAAPRPEKEGVREGEAAPPTSFF